MAALEALVLAGKGLNAFSVLFYSKRMKKLMTVNKCYSAAVTVSKQPSYMIKKAKKAFYKGTEDLIFRTRNLSF
jgi:hypothetical protein